MGDHRFSFKAEFGMHGVKKTLNLDWCNWSGGEEGIDSRITEWIESVRDQAYRSYYDAMDKAEEERRKPEVEKAEREELARLKAKYEPPNG
jgi:hypothetical protein